MKMIYRDGRSGEDELFDMPKSLQIVHVARCMDLDPSNPKLWPIETIERLLSIRQYEGGKAFDYQLHRLLSPN